MPKNPTFMGKMVEVDIYESGKHFMKGQPVSDAKVYTPSISSPLARGEVSGLTEVSLGCLLSALPAGSGCGGTGTQTCFCHHSGSLPGSA